MEEAAPVQIIDLAGVACPMNWVRAKLALEDIEEGQILAIILDSGAPIRNVPQSAKLEGHKVVKVERLGEKYRIYIKRAAQ